MTWPATSARTLYLAAWSSVICAYLGLSAPKIWPALSATTLGPINQFDSTDKYLQSLTGAPHESLVILEALSHLPADKEVVLVLPDAGPRSAFIAHNVTYLIWPRDVRWLPADRGAARELLALPPSTLGAVIFWDVPPFVWLPPGVRLGPAQVMVPLRPSDPA